MSVLFLDFVCVFFFFYNLIMLILFVVIFKLDQLDQNIINNLEEIS